MAKMWVKTCIIDSITNPRSGIFYLGEQVDATFKLKKKEKRIPKVCWPWQTVPGKLVTGCPNEPWAGHYSGSFYEILLMLDLTTGTDLTKNYEISNKHDRDVNAAIAAGFLIATGMHSAVEERFVIGDYLVQSITKESCDDATHFIINVIKQFIKTDKRRRRLK